jgi:hypothetical protein
MTMRTILVLTLVAAFASLAVAADITGKWVAQVPGREGQTREVTYTFKQDGDKLTGSMTGRQGAEIPISDGKVSGDTISFTVTMTFGGNTVKQNYTGTIAGDEIRMKREGGQGPAREFVAKRAK